MTECGPAEFHPKEVLNSKELLRGPFRRMFLHETIDDHPFIDAVTAHRVRHASIHSWRRLSSTGNGLDLWFCGSQHEPSWIAFERFPVVFIFEQEELTFKFTKHQTIDHLVLR